jgi:hypothetical protein
MNGGILKRSRGFAVALLAFALLSPGKIEAQQTAAKPGQAPPTAKTVAPIDLTGYWVAIITQDWRWRMVTPAKGDYAGVPITAKAKSVADTWDPAKDEAPGQACKSYGAPALMRSPTRLHITWQDDNTLKVETDYGMQTRLLHFGNWKGQASPSLQGDSLAEWEISRASSGVGDPEPDSGRGPKAPPQRFGDLKVATTHFSGGYIRKNGLPYSSNAAFLEYWDLFKEPDGVQRIMISNRLTDPEFLTVPWLTVVYYMKEPNDAKWDPTPCNTRW